MQRQKLIKHWLQEVFSVEQVHLEVASADASFRRYFRTINNGRSYIVMDAPPEHESLEPFAGLAEYFREHGLHTPKIYAREDKQGFLLLSDFGSTCYLDTLNNDSADALYKEAIDAIVQLQHIPKERLPAYDETLLQVEMSLFSDWYLGKHLNVQLDDAQRKSLQQIYDVLAKMALSQPQVSVHRDYHSRNLMVVENNNPGVIDFQDAVSGALTYDVVSLLKDCYISWPDDKVAQWLKYYYDKIMQSEMAFNSPFDFNQLQRWFDFMGVQRHLKAVGIFARLYHRDGKAGYMEDIPRVLAYIQAMAKKYPELAMLQDVCLLDETNIV